MVCIPPLDIINVYAKSSPGNYNSFGQISPFSVSVNKYDTIQVDMVYCMRSNADAMAILI